MKNYDVIVIGSGISGLNFALRAAEKYKRVLVVTKKKIAETGTNFAQGGIAAVLSKLDNYKKHIDDTLTAGCFHNDKKAVSYMVKNGPAAIKRLLNLGVPFEKKNKELLLTREGGHGERRIAFVGDRTGQEIERILVLSVKNHPHITLMEDTFAAELLVKNKTCYGVQILHKNQFENVYGEIIVLTTGGAGQVYKYTTNPSISTGDGLAMAEKAGCSFIDLEFTQFHPTALKADLTPMFLISEAVRGEGAYLRNSEGERFMVGKHKLAELAPRDIVARAIFEEEKYGPVYLDLRHKKSVEIKKRFPQIYAKLKSLGFNTAKNLIPITPAAHYMCGGIKVNLKGETGIKNLYAFGEVAGTGVHGANRLASNSLLEALVFSDRILENGCHDEKCILREPQDDIFQYKALTKSQTKELKDLIETLKKTMWTNVGIVRSKKSLTQAKKDIFALRKKLAKFAKSNWEVIEANNMVKTAELITDAALKRKKSLGCHYRTN